MGRYLVVLRTPHIARALVGVFVGRLWYGGASLAILLSARELAGSFAAGGTALACFTATAALGSPVRGRLVDRHGGTALLVAIVSANGALLLALAGLVAARGPIGGMYALCAAAGATTPPLVASLRNVLAAAFPDDDARHSAYVLDGILEQTAFVGGPLATAAAVALASPPAALATGALACVGGAFVFASTPPARAWRAPTRPAGRRPALTSPGLRILAASFTTFGFASGTIGVAVPAFATLAGSRSLAGVLLALLSIGSIAGGVLYGARRWRSSAGRRYVVVLWAFAGVALALAGAGSIAALGALLLLAGCVQAPMTALVFALVDAVAPAGMATESLTWIFSAELAGLAAGSAVAGALVDGPGTRTAFLVGAAVACAGALLALARRRTLELLADAR